MKYSSKWIKFILCKLNIIKSLSKFSLSFSNVKLMSISKLDMIVSGAQGTVWWRLFKCSGLEAGKGVHRT